jgi:DNA-binding transcriptional LysR family regulator
MHLRNVEIFCDVAACRSFSKAAERHHVSQSSVSQAVHMLEKHLHSQLIDRSKRPLELTPAGQVYYDGCRSLLQSFRQVEDRVHALENRVTGRIRVASIYSVGLLQMAAYVGEFRRQFPDVELMLAYLHPDDVYDAVVSDDADLGLVSFPRDGGEIARIPWQDQELVVAAPPGHRLAEFDSLDAVELDGERFVAFTRELTIRRQIDRKLKKADVQVEVVHEFDNVENIKRAVEIGSGVAILPLPSLRRELDAGLLTAISINGEGWIRPLGIVHRRHKTLSTAAAKFVEHLRRPVDAGEVALSETRNNSLRSAAPEQLQNGRAKRGFVSASTPAMGGDES